MKKCGIDVLTILPRGEIVSCGIPYVKGLLAVEIAKSDHPVLDLKNGTSFGPILNVNGFRLLIPGTFATSRLIRLSSITAPTMA